MNLWNKLNLSVAFILAGSVVGAQNIQRLNPPEISKPSGYSHVVVVNGGKMVYIAGQVGLDAKGEMMGAGDLTAQARQAFTNLKAALAAAGAQFSQVVKLNYYVVGLSPDKLQQVRTVRAEFLDQDQPPASTLVGVQALFRPDALIEIEAVAALPAGKR